MNDNRWVAALWQALRPWLARHRGLWLAGIAALALFALADMIPPFLYRSLYDEAIPDRDARALWLLFGGIIGVTAIQGLLAVQRTFAFGRLGARLSTSLRAALLDQIQTRDLADPRLARRADLLNLLGGQLETVEAALIADVPRAVLGLLQAALSAVVLFVVDWRLALVAIVATPISGIGTWLLGGRAQAAQAARAGDEADLAVNLRDVVDAQRSIRAYGLTAYFAERVAGRAQRVEDRAAHAGVMTVGLQSATLMGTYILPVMVLMAASYMVFRDWITVGDLIGFLSLVIVAVGGVQTASESVPGLMRAGEALRRMDALLEGAGSSVGDGPTPAPLERALTIEGVTFGFDPERPVLRDFNLTIEAGQSVAFVGPSGSGKSTALGLFTGFNRPQAGRVCWDGQPFDALSMGGIRARSAAVFQDTDLFAMSVRDNIRLGRLDATDDEVVEVASAVELDAVVRALPQGYDTLLGAEGAQLSGGQRQRLAIARALLRAPDLLLLDEVTSALDPQTEAAINETIARAAVGRTVISVTHRLDAARHADMIHVLRDGALVESGDHDLLMARDGLYAALYRQQHRVQVEPDGVARVSPDLLAELPLLAEVPEAVRADISTRFVRERCRAGQVIMHAGEPGDRMYLVVRGDLRVTTSSAPDAPEVGRLRDGEYFGELALLIDAPRTATVTALTDGLLVTLSRADFLALLDAHPDARQRVRAEADRRLAALAALRGQRG